MIKAIVYDWDDTLVGTFQATIKKLLEFSRSMGFEKTRAEIARHWGKPWEFFVQSVWPGVELKKITERYSLLVGNTKPLPLKGVKDIVTGNSRYIQGIFSGRDRESLQRKIMEAGFKPEWFSFIETVGKSGRYSKADPESFGRVVENLEKLGIKPEETVYVDDSVYGLSASRIGFVFVAVLTGPHTRDMFVRHDLPEDRILNSVAELPGFLRRYDKKHTG